MRKIEVDHNTPEQVRGYLTAALELVAELDPPEDLRPAVFTVAAGLVSAKQIAVEMDNAAGLLSGIVRPGH